MVREGLRRQIEAEIDAARRARAAGNEGRARVCARRAAGHAVRGYREAIGLADHDHSAYFLLRWISSLPSADPSLRASAERLAARVTAEHVLPHPQDPLEDAAFLIERLLEEITRRAEARETEAGDPLHRSRGQDGFDPHGFSGG